MDVEKPFRGSLFSDDFLSQSIADLPDWKGLDPEAVDVLDRSLREIFDRFPTEGKPNEADTEEDLIWPILRLLGWTSSLRRQNLTANGMKDVPDGLLFADDADKNRANDFSEEWKRYRFGLAVVESKRWSRPLDRRSERLDEVTAPSTQILRYLRRADDLTEGKLRWGVLTNGAKWRLYYQGARSVSEQFFEIDLGRILGLPDQNGDSPVLSESCRRHWLAVFMLVFRKEAFLPGAADPRTFHQRLIDESRFYEERVAGNLSKLVFGEVFPELARAIARAAPDAPLERVREAALIYLYRLLFILYAEDRNLLPVRDDRYDDYALRDKVRGDVGRRKDGNDVFSEKATRYWSAVDDLCRAIDEGDPSIGLPPYNGGLFDRERTPLLCETRLGDQVMSDIIDALSFERTERGRRYINYRDLSVQQLGSIYERLLEYELVREGGKIVVRPNIFARKESGSYYTPDDLVSLIIRETIGPLVDSRMEAFESEIPKMRKKKMAEDLRLGSLSLLDPAEKLLEMKICDPAMGSGHFLVNLVDYLADRVITAMAEAEALVENYMSPLAARIATIRNRIMSNAEKNGWNFDFEQLDDRHIIRRMILKRCVCGVDKNPMAVELAKVSLWLHTFTMGAPLSFLDHHLRCGNSLFGMWVRDGVDRANEHGGSLFLEKTLKRTVKAATKMQSIEFLTDAEISEAHRSALMFEEVQDMTGPLNAFLSTMHAFDWMNVTAGLDKSAIHAFFGGILGDPIDISSGDSKIDKGKKESGRFAGLLEKARELVGEERFCHWQVMFPGVWEEWEKSELHGGFDAVIGNPPWDRIKLQQVEWFAARRREIALAERASERKCMIADLRKKGDSLVSDFDKAKERASSATRVARTSGDYPLLSGGDLNLYSLFVERAMTIIKPEGMVGLLTPSGVASDLTASKFFKGVSTKGRLKAFYDFENRRTRYGEPSFFRDVDSRFKFCVFVASLSSTEESARYASYVQDVGELDDPERCFSLTAEDFSKVNPNTGTAPIFRSHRDAELAKAIYDRMPVLVDRSKGEEVKTYSVKQTRMFDMTNDSGLFRTRKELEEKEKAYPVDGNRFRSLKGDWLPLYVGRMIYHFDHRAASVEVNPESLHHPLLSGDVTSEQKADPGFVPTPQYWVPADQVAFPYDIEWAIAFRDVTNPTNARTMIAAVVPCAGMGNTAPVLTASDPDAYRRSAPCLIANFNARVFDYVTRQKVHGTHLNWYIVEQLPVVPQDRYDAIRFGSKTAGEIVRESALELTYTAHDMAPFARDMDYVEDTGDVKAPFLWDEERRLHLFAKLDAVFFHLYGITDRDDVRYVFSTFPIIANQEADKYGAYKSCELCLAYMNALESGESEAKIIL